MKKLLVGTVLCFALAMGPAFAEHHEEGDGDGKGFFFGFEATNLRPSGGIANYTILDPDDSNSAIEGRIQTIEIDEEMAPRVFLGWATGNGGVWGISWWDFDEDASHSVTAASPEELWSTLYWADNGLDSFTGSASADLGVEATTIDVTYSRPLTHSEKFSTRWNVGLRSAELNRGLFVVYDDSGFLYNVGLGSEAEGFGFTGGITGTLKLSDRWMIHGGSSYSAMMGDFDTATFMSSGGTTEIDVDGEREGGFSILEAKCSVVWQAADWLNLWLGYEYQQWNDVLESNVFPDDVAESFLQTDISDVTFSGFTFGAGFKF